MNLYKNVRLLHFHESEDRSSHVFRLLVELLKEACVKLASRAES